MRVKKTEVEDGNIKARTDEAEIKRNKQNSINKATDGIEKVEYGDHYTKQGRRKVLKSNVKYVAGREDRLATDDGGHLIASIFKGSGELDNLVPMDANLNRSAYKKLESDWAEALNKGKEVKVKIKPIYEGDSLRPTSFNVRCWIDGEKTTKFLENKAGG